MSWRQRERLVEKRGRSRHGSLAAIGRIGRLGDPSLQQEFHVSRKRRNRGIERTPVRREHCAVARVGLGVELQRAQLDVATIVIGKLRRERTRTIERGTRVRRPFNSIRHTLRPTCASASDGSFRSACIERSRRLDPHIGVEIGEPLIVEASARRARLVAHGVVRHANAGTQRNRSLQHFRAIRAVDVRGVLRGEAHKADGANDQKSVNGDVCHCPRA